MPMDRVTNSPTASRAAPCSKISSDSSPRDTVISAKAPAPAAAAAGRPGAVMDDRTPLFRVIIPSCSGSDTSFAHGMSTPGAPTGANRSQRSPPTMDSSLVESWHRDDVGTQQQQQQHIFSGSATSAVSNGSALPSPRQQRQSPGSAAMMSAQYSTGSEYADEPRHNSLSVISLFADPKLHDHDMIITMMAASCSGSTTPFAGVPPSPCFSQQQHQQQQLHFPQMVSHDSISSSRISAPSLSSAAPRAPRRASLASAGGLQTQQFHSLGKDDDNAMHPTAGGSNGSERQSGSAGVEPGQAVRRQAIPRSMRFPLAPPAGEAAVASWVVNDTLGCASDTGRRCGLGEARTEQHNHHHHHHTTTTTTTANTRSGAPGADGPMTLLSRVPFKPFSFRDYDYDDCITDLGRSFLNNSTAPITPFPCSAEATDGKKASGENSPEVKQRTLQSGFCACIQPPDPYQDQTQKFVMCTCKGAMFLHHFFQTRQAASDNASSQPSFWSFSISESGEGSHANTAK